MNIAQLEVEWCSAFTAKLTAIHANDKSKFVEAALKADALWCELQRMKAMDEPQVAPFDLMEDEGNQKDEQRVQAYNGIFVSYEDAALWEIEKVQNHLQSAQQGVQRRVPGTKIPKGSPRFLHFRPVGFPEVHLVSNVVHDLTAHSDDAGNTTSIVFHYAAHSLKHSLTVCKTKEWAELMQEATIERHPCMLQLLALENQKINAINAAAPKRFE